MAWALQFNGTDEHGELPGNFSASGDFSITGQILYEDRGSFSVFLANTTGSVNSLQIWNSGLIRATINNNNIDVTIPTLSHGDVMDFDFNRVGTTVTLEVNGVSNSITNSDSLFLRRIASRSGTERFYQGQVRSLTMVSTNEGLNQVYDPTLSDHQSTILTDVQSGIDIQLFNTDASNWIDLGGDSIMIDTPTGDTKCKKADGSGNAAFTVSGTYSLTLAPNIIEYSFDETTWNTLDAAPGGGNYSGNVVVNGQETIYVRAQNTPGVTNSIDHVTAGYVIAAMFQSNQAGRMENNQIYTVTGGNPTPMMYKAAGFTKFATMADPTGIDGFATGSMWPLIAQKYSDMGVPVIVANVAQGGSSFGEWQKGDVSGYYQRITDFAADVGGIDIVVGLGGETDAVNGETSTQVETWMSDFANDIFADFGAPYYQTYFPVGDGLGATQQQIDDVRAGYDNAIANNPNCSFGGDLISLDIDIATYPGNDGIHIYSDMTGQQGADIQFMAFTGSRLTINTTGVPDGSYDSVMWDVNGRDIAYSGVVSVIGDVLTLDVTAPLGATIMGDVYDPLGGDSDGMRIKGTTS